MARILAWCSAVVLALPPGSCCFVLNVLSAASAASEAAPVPVHTCCRAPVAPPDNDQQQVPAKPAAACCCQQDAAQPKHPDVTPDAFACVALAPPHGLAAPAGAALAEHVGVVTSSVPSLQLLHCVWLC